MASPIRALGDHWFAWTADLPAAATLRVHAVEHDDGRYHLDQLVLEGALSAEVLRAVPVGRVEAAVNAYLHGDTEGIPRTANPRIPARLRANRATGYPHEFYEAVAGAYQALASRSPRPVLELANANDVPVTTAHRWVKEARQRGLLAPGRSGKAG